MSAKRRSKKRVPHVGELRRSQVLRTFGPGAMLDLPDHAVILGGLDSWYGDRERIYEDRLASRVCDLLELDEVGLYAPPIDDGSPAGGITGMTAYLFPTWFLGQVEATFTAPDGREYRTRPLVPWNRLVKGGYLSETRKVVPVVPVRFVQACVRGHISDVDWYAFVRRDFRTERTGQLWLDEGGAGNDFSEIFVRCEKTRKRRPLSEAEVKTSAVLGRCRGRQPWLGPAVWEECPERNRLLVRSASTAYFARTETVISIPDRNARVKAAVDEVFEDFLQYAESAGDVERERKKHKVFNALEGLSNEVVWAEVERRKRGVEPVAGDPKQAEIETLLSSPDSIGDDEREFYARTRSLEGMPDWLRHRLERVVLIHKMREVVALLGFTRFEALAGATDELSLNVELAPLAREVTWVPAVENNGEGIFLAFREEAIQEWLARDAVQRRGLQLEAGFAAWRSRKKLPESVEFPRLPRVMLHSLSHLLITALSLECGYAASSVRERIYAGESGYGILLYTASPGTEGTLGGLVDVGRKIEDHLRTALDLGRLCSNDPICADHDPTRVQEERFLHGAACHGCLLTSETSCEMRNELLDRSLVVPTVRRLGAEFFSYLDFSFLGRP